MKVSSLFLIFANFTAWFIAIDRVRLYRSAKASTSASLLTTGDEGVSTMIDKTKTSSYSSRPLRAYATKLNWRTGGHFYHIIKGIDGTDKATNHRYQYMYAKYLDNVVPGFDFRSIEIGLGCGVIWGPGRSHTLWQRYIPDATWYFFDYNRLERKCRKLLKHAGYLSTRDKQYILSHILFSDQTNVTAMRELIPSSVGGKRFDMVVDDGGHFMKGNINSFNTLMDIAVVPGGIYVVEDIFTSFLEGFGATAENQKAGYTMTELISDVMAYVVLADDSSPSAKKHAFPRFGERAAVDAVHSVECDREICVFIKKWY
eukprot:PhM_4_TR8122/c0_g1_i1/m.18183